MGGLLQYDTLFWTWNWHKPDEYVLPYKTHFLKDDESQSVTSKGAAI